METTTKTLIPPNVKEGFKKTAVDSLVLGLPRAVIMSLMRRILSVY